MSSNGRIDLNDIGGFNSGGSAFSHVKWLQIQSTYEDVVRDEGNCSCRRLVTACKISKSIANKAIVFIKQTCCHVSSNETMTCKD